MNAPYALYVDGVLLGGYFTVSESRKAARYLVAALQKPVFVVNVRKGRQIRFNLNETFTQMWLGGETLPNLD